MDSVYTIIKHFCKKNNIYLKEDALSAFPDLCDMLLEFNSHTNLTAIKDREGVTVKHFCDSLSSLPYNLLCEGAKVIDVGCGAGFPGLPLALAREDISVSFLDSTAKKLNFTRMACERFGISAQFYPCRAEEAATDDKLRENYDVAVSRAVASLPVLCELCLPFVKVGGTFIAYKAMGAVEELEMSRGAIGQLGGKFVEIKEVTLPELSGETLKHSLVIIKKIKETPERFPRRYSQIVKKPL